MLASDVSIQDIKNIIVATNVEDALQEIDTQLADNATKMTANTNAIATNASAILSIASGGPKSTYATLALLQADFPTGNTNIYLVTADGKWYYWNGSAWTAGGVYQATGLGAGTVNYLSTNFVTLGTNLFDIQTITPGYSIGSGGPAVNVGFDTSDFIPVKLSTVYSNNNTTHVSFWDVNKVYISQLNGVKSFTTPSNCYYVRIDNYRSSFPTTSVMIVEGGTIPARYMPFAYKITKGIELASNSIDSATTNFLARTANIFDQQSIIDNFVLSGGTLSANTVYAVSGLMPVTSSTLYATNNSQHIAFFDANRVYISSVNAVTSFTAPSNCLYIQIDYNKSVISANNIMVVAGSTLPTSYVPYYKLVYEQLKSSDLIKAISTWLNKNWTSYGDSITNLGTWQSSVLTKIPLLSTVRGIGGTTVAHTGSIAWVDSVTGAYVNRPIAYGGTTDTQPAGTTQINSSFCDGDRISAMIPSASNVITIMGGTNDYYQNIPIGTIADVVNTTFYGGYISLLTQLYTLFPNARIILMTQPMANNDTIANTVGSVAEDYRTATRAIANKFGYQLIDIKPNMGVNELNYATYLSDGTHPNQTGANRLAEVVVGGLNAVAPLS